MAITDIIAGMRRVVHSTFGETAYYEDPFKTGRRDVSVRWHNRVALRGNIEDEGYSDIIEGINRAIFNQEELKQEGITLNKGGRVTLTHPLNGSVMLLLDSMEPHVGPINEVWNVVVA